MDRNRRRWLAHWLIHFSLRFSPVEARDWGRAMLAELEFVKTSWAALAWGAGGATVLWRQAFFSLFRGSRGAAHGPSGAFIPAKEMPMRKSVFIAAAACVIASLAFFLAPSFNQALRLSLQSWGAIFRPNAPFQSGLSGLAARAEKQHDANLLAFTALRIAPYGSFRNTSPLRAKSLRLADEAVRLDPRLTWIYADIVARNPDAPESKDLIKRLRQWDPGNALPDLLLAECQEALLARQHSYRLPPGALVQDSKWLAAMGAAFSAKKYDSYFNQRLALAQDVARSGEVSDPLLLAWAVLSSPIPDLENINDYSLYLIESGQPLEAEGKLKAASQQYWQVARFGQIMRLGAESEIERWTALALQKKGYEPLRSLESRKGNTSEASLLGYQLQSLARESQDFATHDSERVNWLRTAVWIADYIQLSALGLLLSALVLVISGVYWLAQLGRRLDTTGRLKLLFIWLGVIGAAGMLLSSVELYFTYRPYAAMLNQFVKLKGAAAYFSANAFLAFAYPGMVDRNALFSGLWKVYFWYGVISLCAIALVAILARHVIKPLRPKLAG